jgi:hypothetical protein
MTTDDHDEAPLRRDRWVRIMCDYAADGVWDKEGLPAFAEDLPVSPSLRAMLKAWQDWYEHCDLNEPDPEVFDLAAHSVMGLCVARLVKRALPDWTVIYYDECRAGHMRLAGRDGPRSEFEYEILLAPAP